MAHAEHTVASRIRPAHPRLFVTNDNLHAYRKWVLRHETDRFTHLMKWLESRRGGPREPPDWKARRVAGHAWIDEFRTMMALGWEVEARLRGMAFAFLITGDAKWLAVAIAEIDTVLSWDLRGPSGTEMFSRATAMGLAMAYDWLYHSLAPALRTRIRRNVKARFDALRTYYEPARNGAIGTHSWTVLGLRGVAGIVFCHDVAWGQIWVREAYGAFDRYYPRQCFPDGGLGSGVGYWVPWLSWPFQVALWAATGIDLMARTDYYKNAFYFLMYQMNPRGIGLNFGDTNIGDFHLSYGEAAEFLGRKYHVPQAFWWAEWNRKRLSPLREDAHGRDRSFSEFYHLLWCGPGTGLSDKQLPAVTPAAANATMRVFPDSGFVFGHTAWDKQDVEWGLHCGKSMPHAHADMNGLVVHANGVPLLVDSGYYDYYGSPHHLNYSRQTVAHNTLLVDKNPQSQEWGSGGGRLVYFNTRKSSMSLVAETEEPDLYKGTLKRFTRSLVFIPPTFFVVADEVIPAGARHLSFLFHSLSPALIQTCGATIVARYKGRSGQAWLSFLYPAEIGLSRRQAFPPNDTTPARAPGEAQSVLTADLGKVTHRTVFIWTLQILDADSGVAPVTLVRQGNDAFELTAGTVYRVRISRQAEGRLVCKRMKS